MRSSSRLACVNVTATLPTATASTDTPLRDSRISGGIRNSRIGCSAFFTPDLAGRRAIRILFIDYAARGLIKLSMTRSTPVGSDVPTAAHDTANSQPSIQRLDAAFALQPVDGGCGFRRQRRETAA